jgi:hypothetical protein
MEVHRMNPRFSLVLGNVLLLLALGCGSSSSTQEPVAGSDGSGGDAPAASDPVDPGGAGVDPNDPSLEVDPQICATDADCMVGTPRDCCTGFCPEHRVAWSNAAWAAYQDDCAVVECANPESLACQPERDMNPNAVAVCVRERCVLR